MDFSSIKSGLGGVLANKQPSTSGAGKGGAQNFAGGGGTSSSNAGGSMNAGEDFGGASLGGSASSSAAGGGGGGGGAGGGGGYSGAVADQRQLLSSLKSENKNKLATNLDYSGNAGQRGASFNLGTGTQTNAALGAGGSSVKWIVAAVAGVVLLGGYFLMRRK